MIIQAHGCTAVTYMDMIMQSTRVSSSPLFYLAANPSSSWSYHTARAVFGVQAVQDTHRRLDVLPLLKQLIATSHSQCSIWHPSSVRCLPQTQCLPSAEAAQGYIAQPM